MVDLKQGDCLELMRDIPTGGVDMILADLPYGTTKCKWDQIIPFDKLWEQYNRIIKSNGAIVLFGTEPFTSQLVGSNLKGYREHLTWIKHRPSNFANAKYMHMKYTEDIIVFGYHKPTFNRQMMRRTSPRIRELQKNGWVKKTTSESNVSFKSFKGNGEIDSKIYSPNFKNPSDYLEFPAVVNNSKEKTDHPTQKPIKLLKYLIKTYTNPGELVLDNCMGSGSTGVSCVETGRNFIGMELDQHYFEVSQQRIKRAQEERSHER